MAFVLGDFTRHPERGDLMNEIVAKNSNSNWLGNALVLTPFEAHTKIDYTAGPGAISGLYYGLTFQLGKWEFKVQKADEWVEVSPAHQQYYQLTHKQKEELENRIKQGLASAAQSVADLELLKHDERKYREFLHYIGYRTNKELGISGDPDDITFDHPKNSDEAVKKRQDNHSLKAVFIDQVDVHTGDGISMRSIVSRWPTLITDFIRLSDDDTEPDKVKDGLDVSKAEAVVLVTKNKLFSEWKHMFLPEIRNRYQSIRGLVRSRVKSVEEYREWLKPLVARHKMLKEGLSGEGTRRMMHSFFVNPIGHANSFSSIEVWAWKDFISPEIHKGGSEEYAKKPVNPYDDWTKKNFIFHPEHGLVTEYPWITDEWCKKQKKWMSDPRQGWLSWKPYYSLIIITLSKTNLRMPTGEETEDGVFDVNYVFMSKNAMFAKLLQLKAKEEEQERYINHLLGLPHKIEGENPYEKGRGWLSPARKFFDWFGMNFALFKGRGPYERDFDERITKYYLAPTAKGRYVPIVKFIKDKIGYAKT